MNRFPSPNRATLESVALQLKPLLPDLVFVGGQVAELLITDPAAIRVRPTVDVAVVVSTTSKIQYRSIEQRLAALGLRNDQSEGAPICRWLTPEGLKVDVMAADQEIMGFSNQWYPTAIERAVEYRLTDEVVIRIPTAPVFLATKWEAFLGRGEGDILGSHDLEDIITVVAGRPEVSEELGEEPAEVRTWLARYAREFLDNPQSVYALQGALPDTVRLPDLLAEIQSRFEQIAGSG